MPSGFILASGPPLQLNFGRTTLSRADSCHWVNVWFLQGSGEQAEGRSKKLTEHEVAEVAALEINIAATGAPWRFRPAINNFDRNLSVTANFLRTQTIMGLKKETPPGGAGENTTRIISYPINLVQNLNQF